VAQERLGAGENGRLQIGHRFQFAASCERVCALMSSPHRFARVIRFVHSWPRLSRCVPAATVYRVGPVKMASLDLATQLLPRKAKFLDPGKVAAGEFPDWFGLNLVTLL
jgi:hypothetical protein